MIDEVFSIVSKEEAGQAPYPYIYVMDNGAYRELSNEEKEYLETKFHGADGGRPYVKWDYYKRTPDNRISGFLKRSSLPKGIKPGDVPPPKP